MNTKQHDSEPTKQFFDRWSLYQQIIQHDYMAHRGIHAALREFVLSKIHQPFTILDLGCGDSSAIPSTFFGTNLQVYTGVDLSPMALAQAAKNLSETSFQVHLIENDFTSFLAQKNIEKFDIILIGFALHHLYTEEKREFFKGCYNLLKPSGYLLIYDTFRQPESTRQEYIQAYLEHCQQAWTLISTEGLTNIMKHVNQADFPETDKALARMAQEAGFLTQLTSLFTDKTQFHRLYSFQVNSCRE
jgi:ubiquinone/menaquinone biosynthesis C-methylase UbiE